MSEYTFSTSRRGPPPSSYIPRPIMPPPSISMASSKQMPSSFGTEEKNPSRVRRLSSLSHLAKSLGRRKSTFDENQILRDSTTASLATSTPGYVDPPQQSTARRSSPHPKKEILPRSSTTSNLPVPTFSISAPRMPAYPLPSSNSTASFIPSRIPTPNAKRALEIDRRRFSLQPRTMQATLSSDMTTLNVGRKKSNRYSMAGPLTMAGFDKENHSMYATADDLIAPRKVSYMTTNSTRSSTEDSRKKLRKSIDEMFPMDTPRTTKKKERDTFSSPQVEEDEIATPHAIPNTSRDTPSPEWTRKSHDIVHHQLLKTISPCDVQRESRFLSPQTGDRNEKVGRGCSDNTTSPEKHSGRSNTKPFTSVLNAITRRQSQGITISPSQSPAELSPDRFVFKAQPSAFWTGRYMALNDRFLNEICLSNNPSASDHIMPGTEDSRIRRTRKIFVVLDDQCKTRAARKSLSHFKAQFAIVKRMPELLITPLSAGSNLDKDYPSRADSASSHYSDLSPVDSEILNMQTQILTESLASLGKPNSQATVGSQISEVTFSSTSKGRKSSFMERLLGKGRRQSGSDAKETLE